MYSRGRSLRGISRQDYLENLSKEDEVYPMIMEAPLSRHRPSSRTGVEHTIPRERYLYRQIPLEEYMRNVYYPGYRVVRSSIIPYVIKDRKVYWLLGSFHDFSDILTDFGGDCVLRTPPKYDLQRGERQEMNRQHQFGCAMLEVNEESKGLLTKPLLESFAVAGNNSIQIFQGYNRPAGSLVYFALVPLELETAERAIRDFPNVPSVLNERLGPINLYPLEDILARKYRTSRNLTDFVDYLVLKN